MAETQQESQLDTNWVIERVASSPSTNVELLNRAMAGEVKAPFVLVADYQTAGRGRDNREWITPPHGALTMSVLVNPHFPMADWGLVPLWAGLACQKALISLGFAARLKWPNDVLLPAGQPIARLGNWRKVGGILCQSAAHVGIVIGIGINVTQTKLELPVPTATSLALNGSPPTVIELQDAILNELAALLNKWHSGVGLDMRRDYQKACISIGSEVTVTDDAMGQVSGLAVGISAAGALLVRQSDGEVIECHAGDLSLQV